MSISHQTPVDERRDATVAESGESERHSAGQRAAQGPLRARTRRRNDLFFLLGVLALGAFTVLALANAAPAGRPTGTPSATASKAATATAPAPTATRSAPPVQAAGATVREAQVRVYPLQEQVPGLMQPAVDAEGNIWVGEMFSNSLARLNPATGKVDTWTPPNGRNNIMTVAPDAHGDIWFTEQAANYIGRFDPTTQQFTTYPLGQINGHSTAPQDLQFDGQGALWFTEESAGKIGRLDPATGAIQTWAVPAPDGGAHAYPFCISVTSDNQVWFGYLTGGAVGRLDPANGQVTLAHLKNAQTQVYAMAADKQGRIWFTELEDGRLGRIDTATGAVTELDVPTPLGDAGGLYGVTIAPDGAVWFASANANALVRYAPDSGAYTFYRVADANSVLFGVALDHANTLWFTSNGTPANYIGRMNIGA